MQHSKWSQFALRHWPTLRDIIATTGARVYSAVLALVTLSLSARWLGPEGRGTVVVVTTWVGLFAGVGYLSLGQICIHRAANSPDQQWLGPTFAALLIITASVSMGGWAVAALLYKISGDSLFGAIPGHALALGFIALPFLVWEQYGSALLSVIGRIHIYNLNQVISRSLGLGVMVLTIVGLGFGVTGFLLSFVITQASIAAAGIEVLRRHTRGRLGGGLARIGGLVRDGLKVHLNSIGVLLFAGVDILMLNNFRGPGEAGVFQLPMQLFLAMLLVPQSALLVLQSKVASSTRAEFWLEQRTVMIYVVGGMAAVGAALWVLSPWIINFLAGSKFADSTPVFRILLLAAPVGAFNTLMSIQWITRGHFYRVSLITFATGALNCGLNLILIPRYGAAGAAFATVAGVSLIPLTANSTLAILAQREAKQAEARHA